jgi:hypothetical protein
VDAYGAIETKGAGPRRTELSTPKDNAVAENPSTDSEWYPQWVTTWYGLPARVVPSDDGLCDIALLGVPLPHPSLINAAIRRGMPDRAKRRLSFLHEFGHLQTLPLLALPLFLLRRKRRTGLTGAALNILALESFWELVTETYVVFRTGREYLTAWRTSRNPATLLFWPLMLLFVALPFLASLTRPKSHPGI